VSKMACFRMLIIFMLSLSISAAAYAPAVSAAPLGISFDSDTAMYMVGEVAGITITGNPFKPVSVSVINSTGQAVFSNSSLEIDSSGVLLVPVNLSGFATGPYRVHVVRGSETADKNFTLVLPSIELSSRAIMANGSGYSRPTSAYYYYNGSPVAVLLNVSAPNSHFSVSANLTGIGAGTLMLSPPLNGTWSKGTLQDGRGWYAFIVNASIDPGFSARGSFALTFLGSAGGQIVALNGTQFLALVNVRPQAMIPSLGGNTTRWEGIADFTHVEGLTFEWLSSGSPLTKAVYTVPVDLCDPVTISSVTWLDRLMTAGQGQLFINATALPALNVNASVTFAGFESGRQPGILFNGMPAVMAGEAEGGPVSGLVWDAALKELRFNASSAGLYVADNSPPYLVSSIPGSGQIVGEAAPRITFLVNDTVSRISPNGIMLKVGNQSFTLSASGSHQAGWIVSADIQPLEDGWHSASVMVKDEVGNLASLSFEFATDTTPPYFAGMLPQPDTYTNKANSTVGASFGDNVSGVDKARVFLDGQELTLYANFSSSGITVSNLNLSEGIHSVRVEVVDRMGNGINGSWNFTVDLTPPYSISFSPERNLYVPLNNSIFITYADNYLIDTGKLKILVDGVDVTNMSSFDTSTLLYWPSPILSKGPHNVSVDLYDAAGNVRNVFWTFTVDNVPPAIYNFNPSSGAEITTKQVTISATVTDNLQVDKSTIVIKVDGVDVTRQATIGEIVVSYSANLNYGVHTVEIRAMDIAYNEGIVTWTFTISEPQGLPPGMITDILIMAIVLTVAIVTLLALFMRGGKRRSDDF